MNVQVSVRHMAASKMIKQMVNDLCHEVKNEHEIIQNIDVKIEDINGPYKDGIDKRCHLKVRGKNHLAIDVDDINEDMANAIDQAFHRLRKTLKTYSYNKYNRPGSYEVNNCDSIAVRGEYYE